MRTEREVRAKLRYLEKRKKAFPNFWNILVLNTYMELLEWWRGGTFGHTELRPVLPRPAKKKRGKHGR